MAEQIKNPPAVQETWVWSLGQEDPLKEEVAAPFQYSRLKTPMDREAWQALVQRAIRVRHDWAHTHTLLGKTHNQSSNLEMSLEQKWKKNKTKHWKQVEDKETHQKAVASIQVRDIWDLNEECI